MGHAYPRVVEAVKKVCDNWLTFGAPTEKELILAELIQKCVPSMQMLRLVSSGTEAVMSAVRVARGYTKREKIIKFIRVLSWALRRIVDESRLGSFDRGNS